jgi:hypothetical protein
MDCGADMTEVHNELMQLEKKSKPGPVAVVKKGLTSENFLSVRLPSSLVFCIFIN